MSQRATHRLTIVAVLMIVTAGSAQAYRQDEVATGPIPATIPNLRNAFALGKLVRLDRTADLAEFRISCGWYYAPKRKLRTGLWKVSLRGLTFGWETSPAHPGSGHVETVSLTTWERRAMHGWSGTLRLRRGAGGLSNGPTTDICAGIAG